MQRKQALSCHSVEELPFCDVFDVDGYVVLIVEQMFRFQALLVVAVADAAGGSLVEVLVAYMKAYSLSSEPHE